MYLVYLFGVSIPDKFFSSPLSLWRRVSMVLYVSFVVEKSSSSQLGEPPWSSGYTSRKTWARDYQYILILKSKVLLCGASPSPFVICVVNFLIVPRSFEIRDIHIDRFEINSSIFTLLPTCVDQVSYSCHCCYIE